MFKFTFCASGRGAGGGPAYENLWLLLPFQALSVYNRM